MNRRIYLDLRKIKEQRSAHEYLEEIFGFPVYYGHNLDALYDCLMEMLNCEIILQYEEEACLEATYGERVLEVLEEAAYENPLLKLFTE